MWTSVLWPSLATLVIPVVSIWPFWREGGWPISLMTINPQFVLIADAVLIALVWVVWGVWAAVRFLT